jgi:type II secretory pathway pseudopilin PulG
MHEKQIFKTSHVFSMLVLMGLSIATAGSILSTSWVRPVDTSVRDQAESLALQLANTHYDEKGLKDLRGPASILLAPGKKSIQPEGEIGKDSWGSAFHYRILRKSGPSTLVVAVWSPGPNQVNDSQRLIGNSQSGSQMEFIGDDIGVVLNLSVPN